MHPIAEILSEEQGESAFAVRRSCAANALELSVRGVGTLELPVSATTARRLLEVAKPAPFGWGEETRLDKGVRDTWQVAKSRVRIAKRAWSAALAPHLEAFREALGLPEDARLVAELDKLLVYGPGQFFQAHRDSERDDAMVGSLEVVLPSQYRGGDLTVRHHDGAKTFRRTKASDNKLTLIAFYADCEHEVKPVEGGYRVVLSHHLLLRRGAARASVGASGAMLDRLEEAVAHHFATPALRTRWDREGPTRPDRLIYLLDHAYSTRSLSWERLKRDDRVRAEALREVANRIDLTCFLVLADDHEHYSCEEQGRGYGRWGRWEWEDDDEGEIVLGELIDSDLALREGVGADGEPAPRLSAPLENEVVVARPSSELPPFQSAHEGYMGNYGNTVDRWYHRAAVVLWPRARTFALKAQGDPAWAARQIVKALQKGEAKRAHGMLASLRPEGGWRAIAEERRSLLVDVLHITTEIDDGERALSLLRHFDVALLNGEAVGPLAKTLERHGAAFARALFTAWQRRFSTTSWHDIVLLLCKALVHTDGEVAEWLIEDQVRRFVEGRGKRALYGGSLGDEECTRIAACVGDLLEAAVVSGLTAPQDGLVRFIHETPTISLSAQAELLVAWRARCRPAMLGAMRLRALYLETVVGLEEVLRLPPRAKDDWSIDHTTHCACELCEALVAFLADANCALLAWPLSKERRRHVHHQIDSAALPVRHVTERKGRPFTLLLTKLPALFEDDRVLRERQRALLGELRAAARAFRGSARSTRRARP